LEKAKTNLPLEEDYLQFIASSATLTAYSFDQQYAIVEISSLLDAFTTLREPCVGCQQRGMMISNYSLEGHGIQVEFKCINCLHEWKWLGTQRHEDGSLKVNCDVVVAWKVVGCERGKYFKFTEALRCGQYNRTSWDKTVQMLYPVVHNMAVQSYKETVDYANKSSNGSIVGCDVQHSRSQRAVGAAPFAGCVFMLHNKGQFYSRILYQQLVNNQMLVTAGKAKTASKDKHATHLGLAYLAQQLNQISGGVCDGSSSANKSWRDLIQSSSKFNNPPISNCFWHKAKSIPAKFNSEIADKRVLLPKNQQVGNRRYTLKYPQFQEYGITGNKIKSSFYRAQRLSHGDVDEMEAEFIGTAEFYQFMTGNELSKETMEVFTNWLESFAGDFHKYANGLLTDIEESFHRLILKYWKKGSSSQFEEYQLARELAALDWNENIGQPKDNRTTFFRKNIIDNFNKMMSNR
jgi:hypothetical protein